MPAVAVSSLPALQQCLMSSSNHSSPSSFILTGIPGLEDAQFWIAFPFCTMYLTAVLGNITLLLVIRMDPSLHTPMFYFLSMLAALDLVLTTSTMPKLLSIFWFHSHEISFEGCVAQMFFIHTFSITESGVLLTMAFDRYLAICKPLHYSAILTGPTITKLGLAAVVRGVTTILPVTCMVTSLSYCGPHIIHHSYCEHMSVVKLACGDTRRNSIYGITLAVAVASSDSILITVSYVLILREVIGLSSREARLKSFGTCGSHIGVILLFYTPALFSFYTQRWGQSIPPQLHILMADLYLLVPPMLNPLIYGMRTKQIRDRVFSLRWQK
ncbi:olfactory receptor 52K2-like [Falco rusticolus]|uniref:olfactory receptor 52K2-like n=1 Tax=Falco rusticolus TaxID=120794 RepID=UPI00188673F5|nr:olfactory receptor 52K2-like [Falco rusticolus]XP_055559345.1 olfactory receptor 52K2-like [Falco cherrug]